MVFYYICYYIITMCKYFNIVVGQGGGTLSTLYKLDSFILTMHFIF